MIDRKRFFDMIRPPLFEGRISASQAAGLSMILDRWEAQRIYADIRWLAYMLATAHHETGRAMQPVRERGGEAYQTRLYDVRGARPALARRMGNTAPGDGVRYSGRGFVQLTWRNNYRLAGERMGVDLLRDPDAALEPSIAAEIMIAGMAEGWFTGRKLGDYLSTAREDWLGARRVINGSDEARRIKGYALAYLAALRPGRGLQPRAASAAASAASSAKAQGPSARNSAPVAASAATASGPGA